MPRIFVFFIGKHDKHAQRNLANTIENPIREDTVFSTFTPSQRKELEQIRERGNGFYAWGAVPGPKNIEHWRDMSTGDYVLCVQDNVYRYAAQVLDKYDRRRFAESVWGTRDGIHTWQYMYFLTEPVEVNGSVPQAAKYLNAGYRGFVKINDDKVAEIISEFGSVDEFIHQVLGGPRGGTTPVPQDIEESEAPDTVLEVATSGNVNARARLRTAPSARRIISREILERARHNADRIGQRGEQFVHHHVTILKNRGDVEDFEWVSHENAGSAFDFWIRRYGKRVLLDAKSTESTFANKIHVSLGELRQMSNGLVRYDIYRVFEMNEATAKLRVAEDVRDWALSVIDILDGLPEGITVDSISVPPSSLPFGPTIEVHLLE
jgi:hypothetical protein